MTTIERVSLIDAEVEFLDLAGFSGEKSISFEINPEGVGVKADSKKYSMRFWSATVRQRVTGNIRAGQCCQAEGTEVFRMTLKTLTQSTQQGRRFSGRRLRQTMRAQNGRRRDWCPAA